MSELGQLCRSLFVAPPGKVLVGVDASGLELRMLAHHLAEWDGGDYGRLIDEGDVHQHTADVLGFDRELAKRIMYATLYGAGDSKLGRITGRGKSAGAEIRSRLLSGIVGLDALVARCRAAHETKGYVLGLDGRRVPTRSEHSALNSQLQADGAVVMKAAVVGMNRALAGPHWRMVLMVHDEVQAEVDVGWEEEAAVKMRAAIVQAGHDLELRVPLKAEAKIGRTWAETH